MPRQVSQRLADGESIESILGHDHVAERRINTRSPAEHKTRTQSPRNRRSRQRVYYCPMDEGVEQIGPGHCPICGMALVPRLTPGESPSEDNAELVDMSRRFWIGLALAVPLVVWDMLGMTGLPTDHWLSPAISGWLELVLATPIVFWAGWPFLMRGAGRSSVVISICSR